MGAEGIIMEITYIPAVAATDMPPEVEEWCIDNEYSTHYQNDIAQVENDGNPFAKWLIKNGYKFKSKYDNVGIFAS